MEKQKTLSNEALKKAIRIFAARKRLFTLLALFGLIIPEVGVSIYSDVNAIALAEFIHAASASNSSFNEVWLKATSYYGGFFAVVGLSWFLVMAIYFACVRVCLDELRGERGIGWTSYYLSGLKDFFRRGLPVFALFFLLISSQNATSLFSLFLCTLALMAPVLAVVEERGGLSALWTAVSLKYTKEADYNVWNIMLTLFFFGSVGCAAIILSEFASDYFLNLDIYTSIPRDFWHTRVGEPPLRFTYLISVLTRAVVSAIAMIGLAITASCVYFSLVDHRIETAA